VYVLESFFGVQASAFVHHFRDDRFVNDISCFK